MRAPSDMPPRQPREPRAGGIGRGRLALIIAAIVLFVLFTSARAIAHFYTDYLWFASVDRVDVWGGVIWTRVALAALFSGVFFAILLANLWVADRIAPNFRPTGPDDELLRKYHDLMQRRAWLVRVGVAAVCGLLAGVGMSAQWENWLLFRNGSSVGVGDPQFGTDLGFYLFQLPFISVTLDWLFASLIIITFITAVAHYLNGGIRMQSPIERVTPQVKAHLSVMIGLLALVRAADYWFSRYELVYSNRGAAQGAMYTDVNAQLPAIYLLLFIALLSFVLFIVNIRRRGWVLPVVAVGLWAFMAVVVGAAYPAFIQRFQVDPARSEREAEFVARNIEGTRIATGLDGVETVIYEDYTADRDAATLAVENNRATMRNIPLLEREAVLPTFRRLQATRGFYRILGLDVDRYPITTPDGRTETTQVLVGARQLDLDGIPDQSWENRHLVYTHGYGMALAPANVTTVNGQPNYLIGGLPVRLQEDVLDRELERPELYIGEGMSGFAIVNTERPEVSYIADDGDPFISRYEGADGVRVGSFARRASWAIRFADWNTMVSGFINSDSRVLMRRDVRERVQDQAPFLHLDSEVYSVVVDGRIKYIVDAYTTSDAYPYAQPVDTSGLPSRSGLNHEFNYVRNSVKAVVDAYDGTVDFYVMDEDDPIINAWRNAFPDLFSDQQEMSDELLQHIRYPQDLFRVQTTMWGKYHLGDPREFLEGTNAWSVAPGTPRTPEQQQAISPQPTGQAAANPAATAQPDDRVDPYYQLLRLPGDDDLSYVQMRSFTPISDADEGQQLLTAFMAAKSDPDEYGQLRVYQMPELNVDGPRQVSARVRAADEVAQQITLLDERANVSFGDMMLLPLDDTIMYVWPLYLASDQGVPELREVIGVHGNRVVMRPTLREVVDELFGVDIDTFEGEGEEDEDITDADADIEPLPDDVIDDGEDPTTTTTTEPPATEEDPDDAPRPELDADAVELLRAVDVLLRDADEARQNGELGEYQRLVTEALEMLEEILDDEDLLDAATAAADNGPSG